MTTEFARRIVPKLLSPTFLRRESIGLLFRLAFVLAVSVAMNIVAGDIGTAWGQSAPTLPRSESLSTNIAGQHADDFPSLQVPGTSDSAADEDGFSFSSPLVTTVSSLLVVLAIFGGVVWIARRYGHASVPLGALPNDIIQHLGSTQLDPSTKVSLLKCGERILVVGQAAGGGLQTLTEITDPDEVDRMTNRCLGRPEIVGRRTLIDHDRATDSVSR